MNKEEKALRKACWQEFRAYRDKQLSKLLKRDDIERATDIAVYAALWSFLTPRELSDEREHVFRPDAICPGYRVVAKKAKVSVGTVSRVVGDAIKRGDLHRWAINEAYGTIEYVVPAFWPYYFAKAERKNNPERFRRGFIKNHFREYGGDGALEVQSKRGRMSASVKAAKVRKRTLRRSTTERVQPLNQM